jgi:phytoene dehydrogenase-like protein
VTRHYPVIVIGAGLGGLSVATMLARNGVQTLLLERHNVPGGYATSFVRGRYEFEVALHELSGIGPPERRGSLYRYLEVLGVADKVDFVTIPNLYRSVILGDRGEPALDLTLPAGREPFEETLCAAFPREARGIRRFVRRIFDLRSDFIQIARRRGIGNPITMPFRLRHFFRYLPTTWGQVLYRDVKDPYARAVLSQYWGYFGLPPAQVAFLYAGMGLASYVRQGPAFPVGRSQALSHAFVSAFEEAGGEARMNCGVERITTADGRVTGVITDHGEEIRADWVISNADPITTCRDMIGRDQVPPAFFAALQSSEVAPSTVNVYLGVARPAADLGLTEHEIFINPDADFDRHFESVRGLGPPAGDFHHLLQRGLSRDLAPRHIDRRPHSALVRRAVGCAPPGRLSRHQEPHRRRYDPPRRDCRA